MSYSENVAELLNGQPKVLAIQSNPANLFFIKPANQWLDEAKLRAVPGMLFSEFWYEGELCILFADTNLGKSILAVQIGAAISEGRAVHGFKLEGAKQKVLYFDFELSDKQFEARYSDNYEKHYRFDRGFIRGELNPENSDYREYGYKTFEEHLNAAIEAAVVETEAKIVIIDNITYLRDETEKAKAALPLMKDLHRLKKKHGLSILCLAHTPKRDLSQPITVNDLQGSKMLMNFCDSSFAIGNSCTDTNIRYLKQIKQRQVGSIYHGDNVCVCRISKDYNFLAFDFMNTGREREHLKQMVERDKDDNIALAKELSAEGKSQREISKELGIAVGTVNKYLKIECSRSLDQDSETANP